MRISGTKDASLNIPVPDGGVPGGVPGLAGPPLPPRGGHPELPIWTEAGPEVWTTVPQGKHQLGLITANNCVQIYFFLNLSLIFHGIITVLLYIFSEVGKYFHSFNNT